MAFAGEGDEVVVPAVSTPGSGKARLVTPELIADCAHSAGAAGRFCLETH